MRKKTTFLLIILGGVYLIVMLSRDLWQMLGAKNRVVEVEGEVQKLEEEREEKMNC